MESCLRAYCTMVVDRYLIDSRKLPETAE